jgi:YhcH/YjgK/YiaL family protein
MLSRMIIDRLENATLLNGLPPRLRQALDFLRGTDLRAVAVGRHEIDGDRLFALVQEYTTRGADDCAWEAHRRYIDVQYVVRGEERMGYANIGQAREREPYDPARDVAFFEPGEDFVTVRAGMLAVFAPEDVHSPCGAAGKPGPVRKVVVKAAMYDD